MIPQHGLLRALRPAARQLSQHTRLCAPLHTSSSLRFEARKRNWSDSVIDPSPNLVLQTTIVSLMRLVPHSLTVILSKPPPYSSGPSNLSDPANLSDPFAPSSPSDPVGMLVSSFNTVTLTPDPFVSFNVKLPSHTYDIIKSSGRFTASGINSEALARKFLLPSGPRKSHLLKRCTIDNDSKEGPWLRHGIKGPLWWMTCEWVRDKSVAVGDHAIVVGKVVAGSKYPNRDERTGIVYLNQAYRDCANPKEVKSGPTPL